jgi:hypothetical protein
MRIKAELPNLRQALCVPPLDIIKHPGESRQIRMKRRFLKLQIKGQRHELRYIKSGLLRKLLHVLIQQNLTIQLIIPLKMVNHPRPMIRRILIKPDPQVA